ncbi:MAG: radical SAM protein [Thermodesulfobacteriota bacterium]
MRSSGEAGYCGANSDPAVAAILAHLGEEPPLCTGKGAGTIFFSRCNLRCVYCQNHQISQGPIGRSISPETLADCILDLQHQGCSTIEPVSPSHHLPGFLEALAIAVDRGMHLPVVYNSNGYESLDTLALLEGVVDVYLPDMKYADDRMARAYSEVDEYVRVSSSAIRAMHAQVGNLVVDTEGRGVRGLILRHLVLPENVAGTDRVLRWIAENLPKTVTLSLMAQYAPLHKAHEFPPLHRRITSDEYDRAVDLAWEMGFENAFVQDLESPDLGVPDFSRQDPFVWERDCHG